MTPDELDQATVDLLFALRDSLTEVSPLDFWNGRALSALETAAAGSETMPQAITSAARKLQIPGFGKDAAAVVVQVGGKLDGHYEEWAAHIARNAVYVIAYARVVNDTKRQARKAARDTQTALELQEGAPF